MDPPTTRRRLGRSLLAAAALGLAASAVSVVALAPPAAAIPIGGYCGNAYYYPAVDHGRIHDRTEPTQMVENGNPTPVTVTFTSTRSETRSSTASASTTVSGGFKLGIINASVSATFGYSVTMSATTTIGVSVTNTVPAGMTQFGDYGVFKQMTSGDYYSEYWCDQWEYAYVTAYSVRGQGWKVWQA